MNKRFVNAVKRIPQPVPPIWFMRQAGRYHSHYQELRQKYSFEELCKTPELAAEVAIGPIDDFDYDVAILFSDILFPLELLGLNLKYNPGPTFERYLTSKVLDIKISTDFVRQKLDFQTEAIKKTKNLLSNKKSFVGFVGGPWTVLSYGLGFRNLKEITLENEEPFIEKVLYDILFPLLRKNILMQIESGAEIVYVFDTNSSQLDNNYFSKTYTDKLQKELFMPFKNKIAYYSKNIDIFKPGKSSLKISDLAGLVYPKSEGFISSMKGSKNGFIQGNFSPKSLLKPHDMFVQDFEVFLNQMSSLNQNDRNGWICSLNHGVLPKTPEVNVKYFIEKIRSTFSGI